MTVEATPSAEQVILATGGYDHTIKIWQASTGVCQRVCHHVDSVNFFIKSTLYLITKFLKYFHLVFINFSKLMHWKSPLTDSP